MRYRPNWRAELTPTGTLPNTVEARSTFELGEITIYDESRIRVTHPVTISLDYVFAKAFRLSDGRRPDAKADGKVGISGVYSPWLKPNSIEPIAPQHTELFEMLAARNAELAAARAELAARDAEIARLQAENDRISGGKRGAAGGGGRSGSRARRRSPKQ